MGLFAQINEDLKTAMKNKEAKKLEVLRMMKSKIMTVEARGDIPEADIQKILTTYAKNLKDAIEQSEKSGRTEAIAELQTEIVIVESYLPQKLSFAETEVLVRSIVTEVEALSMKDMGKVMKAVMASGKNIEGSVVKGIIEKLLN